MFRIGSLIAALNLSDSSRGGIDHSLEVRKIISSRRIEFLVDLADSVGDIAVELGNEDGVNGVLDVIELSGNDLLAVDQGAESALNLIRVDADIALGKGIGVSSCGCSGE